MMRSMYSAATGMSAQQLEIDTIANNLANVSTTGFKKVRVDFQDLMYQSMRPAGTPLANGSQVPTGLQVGLGTRPAATERIFTQGSFQQTGSPLDVGIEGDGFFQVTLPDGTTAFSRDGSFKRDVQGNLVTSDGYSVSPSVTIPANASSVAIEADGQVSVQVSGQTAPQQVGQLTLARFVNPAGLSAIGRNLYQETAASGQASTGTPGSTGFGTVQQGSLEQSNVSVVEEMVNMITAQRAYEINSKVIQGSDQMLSVVSELKR